jgi:hypothetical protein
MSKFQEIQEELRAVFSGRGFKLLDTLIPLLVFLVLNRMASLTAALAGALAAAIAFSVLRIIQKDSLVYALVGMGSVVLAAGASYLSGSGSAFFLPGVVSGGLTVLVCLGSALLKRPVAALTSHLTRGWPLDWYWHESIRPAYSEVSLLWAAAFASRTGLEYWLLQRGELNALGTVNILLGWPYTILILILSYLYGLWRLDRLAGPSVAEFKAGAEPPWVGQKRGF